MGEGADGEPVLLLGPGPTVEYYPKGDCWYLSWMAI